MDENEHQAEPWPLEFDEQGRPVLTIEVDRGNGVVDVQCWRCVKNADGYWQAKTLVENSVPMPKQPGAIASHEKFENTLAWRTKIDERKAQGIPKSEQDIEALIEIASKGDPGPCPY